MLSTLINVFKIEELRNKILFTLGMLIVFRLGHWIPLPGVNQDKLQELFDQASKGSGSGIEAIATYVTMFSGGSLSQSTIFGLGIMPYITAGIIFQLLASFLPQLKAIQEEGPTGRQKIMEYTRYATVALCVVQGFGWLAYLNQNDLITPYWVQNPLWWVMAVTALTAGTTFLMWLGEQIDKHGIGNGASMIIMAGILASIPQALGLVRANFEPGTPGKMGWMGLILLAAGFVGVTMAAVLMQVAQRRIPVQQAKHTRGRKVYGGQKSYLPMRINHGGVMPIIFASSLMIFPTVVFAQLKEMANQNSWTGFGGDTLRFLSDNFQHNAFLYLLLYVAMIYFFSYFWITVQFNPEEMSKQLKEHGSFIPGLRPGPRTAEYLETVVTRVTFVGAAFLALIAVLPTVVNSSMNVDMTVTQFLGGTGLLIVVSVCMDFLQRVEANLMMRNYSGFLSGDEGAGSSPRLGGTSPR
ncbi:MAG TPA: preprotein translocase subunit SecY [Phycisphaerales bacterium]|nr:preprotein translocase subunit SecY [Phycisphaerales bacterium]